MNKRWWIHVRISKQLVGIPIWMSGNTKELITTRHIYSLLPPALSDIVERTISNFFTSRQDIQFRDADPIWLKSLVIKQQISFVRSTSFTTMAVLQYESINFDIKTSRRYILHANKYLKSISNKFGESETQFHFSSWCF